MSYSQLDVSGLRSSNSSPRNDERDAKKRRVDSDDRPSRSRLQEKKTPAIKVGDLVSAIHSSVLSCAWVDVMEYIFIASK